MANASAARLDPVNMKAGASFYFLKTGGRDQSEEEETFWGDEDVDSDEEDNQSAKGALSNQPSLQSSTSMRIAATRVKSALSFFSVSSKNARPAMSMDDMFNDDISATFVSISDDEGSDDEDDDSPCQSMKSPEPRDQKIVDPPVGSKIPPPVSTSSGASSVQPSNNKSLVSTPSFVKSMNQVLTFNIHSSVIQLSC